MMNNISASSPCVRTQIRFMDNDFILWTVKYTIVIMKITLKLFILMLYLLHYDILSSTTYMSICMCIINYIGIHTNIINYIHVYMYIYTNIMILQIQYIAYNMLSQVIIVNYDTVISMFFYVYLFFIIMIILAYIIILC